MKLLIEKLMSAYKVSGGKMDQHFLIHEPTIEQIVLEADLERDDVVLEIGGGLGNLSEKIAPLVKKLYIVEKDEKLAKIMEERLLKEREEGDLSDIFSGLGFKNVEIIKGDVTKIDLSEIPFNKIVANLPYSISSEITVEILKHKFDVAILMYQYEFAKRLAAEPNGKDYGRISVLTQYKAEPEILFKVPSEYFSPAPKVDSAVIKIKPKEKSEVFLESEEYFFEVTKAIFGQRRKKVKNSIAHNKMILNISDIKNLFGGLCPEVYEEYKISKMIEKRAENLDIEDIAILSNYLYKLKNV